MTDRKSKKDFEHNPLIMASFFGLFIFIFLFIFQPFGISEIEKNKFLFSLSFGALTFIILLIHGIFKVYIFKKFDVSPMSFYRKMYGFAITIPIGILNWILLKIWDVGHEFSFWGMIFITFVIGFIPFFYIVLFVERKYYLNNLLELKSSIEKQTILKKKDTSKIISLQSENINEKIEFCPDNLLFVKAEGNYAQFNILDNNKIKKQIFRISLSSITIQFEQQKISNFIRNHKSYIVNIKNIEKVTGNSRKYYFHLKNSETIIPVSRNLSKDIIENLKNVS